MMGIDLLLSNTSIQSQMAEALTAGKWTGFGLGGPPQQPVPTANVALSGYSVTVTTMSL